MQKNIENAILVQLELNKDTNLLYRSLEAVAKVDNDFINALQQAAKQDIDPEEVNRRAGYSARECLRTIYQLNQYLHVSMRKRDELKQIYLDSWQRIMAGNDIEKVLITFHYSQLQVWLASVYPPQFLAAFEATQEIHPVLNKQYSAEFQVELLGIDLDNLEQPILDIGCGGEGRLVQYLRQRGFDAFGIDRMIDNKKEYLIETDWFEYDLSSAAWGSIISNIAFSNHFQYIIRHEADRVQQYENYYHQILANLIVKGTFYYAPPAAFLEESLSETEFEVQSHLVEGVPYSIQVQKKSPFGRV